MNTDSPDVVIAKQLLDHLKVCGVKVCGVQFWRTAPGEDGPLVGSRVSDDWVDIIHIVGFSRDCITLHQRTSSLIIPGSAQMQRHLVWQRTRCAQRRC